MYMKRFYKIDFADAGWIRLI